MRLLYRRTSSNNKDVVGTQAQERGGRDLPGKHGVDGRAVLGRKTPNHCVDGRWGVEIDPLEI